MIKAFYKIKNNTDNLLDGIDLMPLRALVITDGDGNGYNFLQLEKESSYNIVPLKYINHRGLTITYGYQVSFTIYVMSNRFDKVDGAFFFERLNDYINTDVYVRLILGNEEPSSGGWWNEFDNVPLPLSGNLLTKAINSTTGVYVDFAQAVSLSYEIESVENRHRLKIIGNGYIKALDNNSKFDVDDSIIINSYKSVFK